MGSGTHVPKKDIVQNFKIVQELRYRLQLLETYTRHCQGYLAGTNPFLVSRPTRSKLCTRSPHRVELGETPSRLICKRCRYSSLDKFEDALDTALYVMQTNPSDATFSTVFRTSINADRKQRWRHIRCGFRVCRYGCLCKL